MMPSGLLGKAAPAANTNATLYVVPASTFAIVNLSVVNRGGVDAKVRVACAASDTPATTDWIEYDAVVPANGGVLERTAIAIGAAEFFVVRDDMGTCSYRLFGLPKGE